MAEQKKLKERVEDCGGIDENEVKEMAVNQMRAELGEAAEGTELQRIFLEEIKESENVGQGNVGQGNVFVRDSEGGFWYRCVIDAVEGFRRRKNFEKRDAVAFIG